MLLIYSLRFKYNFKSQFEPFFDFIKISKEYLKHYMIYQNEELPNYQFRTFVKP